MLVREAIGGSIDTCAADATVAQAAKRMAGDTSGQRPSPWMGA